MPEMPQSSEPSVVVRLPQRLTGTQIAAAVQQVVGGPVGRSGQWHLGYESRGSTFSVGKWSPYPLEDLAVSPTSGGKLNPRGVYDAVRIHPHSGWDHSVGSAKVGDF